MNRFAVAFGLLALGGAGLAQDRLPSMPGYKESREHRPKLQEAMKLARLSARWIDDSRLTWRDGETWVILDCKTMQETRQAEEPPRAEASGLRGGGVGNPGRGRQFTEVTAPDGTTKAIYRDGNVFIAKGGETFQLTEGGDLAKRLKYGTASWVYGEELDQREAMGFSPDSRKLWVYHFDERDVKDYHLVTKQRESQSAFEVEAYPKPGQPNPRVQLFIYDLETKKPVLVDMASGEDSSPGHYIYRIRWSPDGSKLLFHAMNRRQNEMRFCAADPATGVVTVLDTDANPDGWVEAYYPTTYLDEAMGIDEAKDLQGKALWISEKSGFANIYLMDWKKGGATPITKHGFDVRAIAKVDVASRTIWYFAMNGDRTSMLQLNKIKFDGSGHQRLTDPQLTHGAAISEKGSYLLDTAQSIDSPPKIQVLDASGKVIKVLRESDVSGMKAAGYEPVERFEFVAADGKTKLTGRIHKPLNFDPAKRYPVIVNVYGGPGGATSNSFSESYDTPDTMCDYGFIVLEMENRGLGGRGREFRNAFYRRMGRTEIDDQANGLKAILTRPYVDGARVGIQGTSYGGYFTLLSLLRYPDLYTAGVSSSCVSDWRNYDTTYTERYMGLLPADIEGYDAGSAVKLAKNLKGWLMIYYGTADDNTHPANTLQVIAALQRERKSFEVQVGPDAGHSGVNWERMMEFFIERLVLSDKYPDGTAYKPG